MAFPCASLPSVIVIKKPEAMHALFFLKIYHFPYFKILQTNPVIISKLVHKNSKQPTLSECTQIQPFYGLVCQTIFVKPNKTKRLHTCTCQTIFVKTNKAKRLHECVKPSSYANRAFVQILYKGHQKPLGLSPNYKT